MEVGTSKIFAVIEKFGIQRLLGFQGTPHSSSLMTFISFFPNLKIVLMSCKISGFLNFHVLHLNYETFKLCLQNTLNMSKTTRIYFGVLHNEL